MTNQGEKRIKFKTDNKIGSLNFQAIPEVAKPLASAAKIANKGNLLVLDALEGESYIYNKASETKIPLKQEKNVYVMDVDYMVDSSVAVPQRKTSEEPFRRQA